MARLPFTDNVAIVTGASSGIGRALAVELASQGARLMLAAREESRLRETAEACRALGAETRYLTMDVTQKETCRDLADRTAAEFGRVDSLFNNAGRGARGTFEDHQDVEVFEQLMAINYFGPVYCTHYTLPHLRKTRGRIVTTSSLVGRLAVPGESAYCASKFAVTGFFDALRIELMGTGVSVTLAHPGFVVTPFAERSLKPDGEPHGREARRMYTRGMMTARQCARRIVRAAAARRREVFTSFKEKLSLWFKLAAPDFTDRMIRSAVEKKDARINGSVDEKP
jgi:short-subunit dehydrogenase